ncbi:MAG: hypothetical protein AAFP19_25815, partial [Bacteroidota bacterium]
MQKLMLNMLILVLGIFLFTACNQTEDEMTEVAPAIEEEEAVEIVEQAISRENYGMTAEVKESVELAEEVG